MKKRGPPSYAEKKVQNPGQTDSEAINYHWMCYAGAQNEGQSCNFYQVLDMEAEGRGAKQDVSHIASFSVQRSKLVWLGLLGSPRPSRLVTLKSQSSDILDMHRLYESL